LQKLLTPGSIASEQDSSTNSIRERKAAPWINSTSPLAVHKE